MKKITLLALVSKSESEKITASFHNLLFFEEDKFELEQKLRKYSEISLYHDDGKLLSQREKTILKMIVKGLTHQQIADRLFLSIHT